MAEPHALDIGQPEALLTYLRRGGYLSPGETPRMQKLDGGVSSRTVRVERASGEAWILKQSLARLRVATDWYSDPRRVHCEAAALRWLEKLAPPGTVPGFVFEDHAEHILAMGAVPQPHTNWKTLLLSGGLEVQHARAFGHLLGVIHRNAAARRADMELDFRGLNFFESLRVEPYYRYAATQVPAAAHFLQALIDDTLRLRLTLVHGDYSPKNVLIYREQLVLLDHEVAHIGDPAFDLGFALTHLLSKAHHLSQQRTPFARAALEFWDTYQLALGVVPWHDEMEPRAVRHTLACLLARVAGRSPLEYLNAGERARQEAVAVSMMPQPPATLASLIEQFTTRL